MSGNNYPCICVCLCVHVYVCVWEEVGVFVYMEYPCWHSGIGLGIGVDVNDSKLVWCFHVVVFPSYLCSYPTYSYSHVFGICSCIYS